jgi:heptosyltransferase II
VTSSPLPDDPRTPLLFRAPNWIGDAVLSLPALVALRAARPEARLGVATRAAALAVFADHPGVDETLVVPPSGEDEAAFVRELRARDYGAALVFSPSFRSALQLWRAGIAVRVGWAGDMRRPLLSHPVGRRNSRPAGHQVRDYLDLVEAVGVEIGDPQPRMHPATSSLRAARALVDRLTAPGRPVVAVAPFAAGGPTKRWGAYDRLIWMLIERELDIAVIGGPDEQRAAGRLLAGLEQYVPADRITVLVGADTVPIPTLAAMAPLLPAMVCNDTGPMHVWAAGGGKVVAVFGSSLPGLHGPLGEGHQTLHRGELRCAGCYRKRCPEGLECLIGVFPGEVLEAVERALGRPDG